MSEAPQVMPIHVDNVNQVKSHKWRTRPGWRCWRRWAWLGGLWHIWDHSQSISLEKLGVNHMSCKFLRIWHTHLCDLAWLTLSTSMIMTWRPLTYLRTFPIDFSLKVGYKTWVIHVFDNFDELTGVLPLVVFVDVDGGVHDAKSGWNQF